MRFGIHLSIAGGLGRTVQRARAWGLECLQIFAGNPRGWAQRPLDPKLAADFARMCQEADLRPVVVHAHYLINLASQDDALWAKSWAALGQQLERARLLGATAVVVHPGSRGERELEWGLERVAQGVRQALETAGPGVECWLENTAGGGAQLGGGLEQMAGLLERLQGLPVGACLDTAHAWGAGYQLDQARGMEDFLDQAERLLGLGQIKLWHLNDSTRLRQSGGDQHQHLGRGMVGEAGFAALVGDPRLAGAAGVLETPKDSPWADRRNLAFLRRLRRQAGQGA